jgi:hypothetical protein
MPTGLVRSSDSSSGSRLIEVSSSRKTGSTSGTMLLVTWYEAYRAAMFLFLLVAASLEGRRPSRECTPTAVGW